MENEGLSENVKVVMNAVELMQGVFIDVKDWTNHT